MPQAHEHIEELNFANVIGDRFGRYSKYIIQDRALPDIRDGLKPVQRRILYAMFQDRNTADNPYRKSAKTVGNVIGNYHPHGDSSVYEAMVRMSQDWKNRESLIDMHGNNGSMDGDPAAAMRYTEARLSQIAMELLRDIHADTVEFALNFDDTLEEPVVLPARFPNLLVNGATGISAGYATDIPPHNLTEVIDAIVYALNHRDYTLKELMKFVKGPDFPTGAIIQGAEALKDIYKTGHGRVVMRAKTEIESLRGGKSQIIATELPYEINKSKLIQKLDDIRLQRKVEGIVDVRDESDRTGVRVVIELRRDADPEPILNYLLKNTDLQMNYNFNMVAIDNRTPKQVGLVEMIQAYIRHQQEVVTRRTKYLLASDQARLHIVDGLIRMVSILDDVIHTIRQSESKSHAKENLVEQYDFSMDQAEAIVSLQLYRLTNTDITALQNERLELNENIRHYHSILKNEKVLNGVLVKELEVIRNKYGSPRRTEIDQEVEEIVVEQSLLVAEERVMVTITKQGYIKRTSIRSFASSDTLDMGTRDFDYVIYAKQHSTHDAVIIITNKGNYIHLPVHELPDIRWKDLGVHFSQLYQLEDNEQPIFVTQALGDMTGVGELRPADNHWAILMSTKEGMIKQTDLAEFDTYRSYKSKTMMAMKLKTASDEVVRAQLIDTNQAYEVVLLTRFSYSLRYPIDQVSKYGLRAQGVIAINLKKDDELVGAMAYQKEADIKQILILTQRGHIKRFEMDIVAESNRGGRGILILKELKSNSHRIIQVLRLQSETIPVIIKGDTGYDVVIDTSAVPISERLSNGSAVSELDKLGQVLTMQPAYLTLVDDDLSD